MLFTNDDQDAPIDGAGNSTNDQPDATHVVNRRLLPGTTIIQTDYHDGSRDFEDAGRSAQSTAVGPTSAAPPSTTPQTYSKLINIPQTIDAHDAVATGQPASTMLASKSTPGAKQPVSTAKQPDGYLARANSSVGRQYVNVVQKYIPHIGKTEPVPAGMDSCGTELHQSMTSNGIGDKWPTVSYAYQLPGRLSQPEYAKYWQKIGSGQTTPISQVPDGTIAVWDKSFYKYGHVAIVAHRNIRGTRHTFLLGSTNGKYSVDITGDNNWNHPVGYYLPR